MVAEGPQQEVAAVVLTSADGNQNQDGGSAGDYRLKGESTGCSDELDEEGDEYKENHND